ncbi:hypothetical protein [Pseudoalteromonas sp. SR45-4]|uniref:hypothetical protein n=1 Tax=Pseudoalteromonas sp. SR45-4 TaxID=2760929 RepID=UPI0015FB4ED4|nr:hypothetical protein [Pseudoalteromonas sp. SR45-4]MBB1372606.1 hypothetical protein [Pseudoalteromonas sp. SR45-4]
MKLESKMLSRFFNKLNEIEANYCVMNNYINMPEVIPSDVDIAIDKTSFGKLDQLVTELANEFSVSITQKIWHGFNKCAFILSPLDTEKYFWLQLDFFVDFSGKGFPNLMPFSTMIKNKAQYKNFYIPAPEVEVPFILQRRIFKGDASHAHIKTIRSLIKDDFDIINRGNRAIFDKEASDILKDLIVSGDISLFDENYSFLRKALKSVSNKNTNMSYRLEYILFQFIRALYRIIYPTGLSIAFVSNDLERTKKIIDSIDERISGSFHGTSYVEPESLRQLSKMHLKSVLWPKITKRKVYINLQLSILREKNTLLYKLLTYLKVTPDLDFVMDDMTIDIKMYTYLILKKQAQRTKRSLFNSLSPTAKFK